MVSQKPRKEVYAEKLGHRIVHLFVFNKKGEMLLQLRSAKVSFCPLHWCTAAAGHVKAGESGEEAAVRECEEELGFIPKPYFLFKDLDYYDVNGHHKILYSYKSVKEDGFKPSLEEVEKVRFFSLKEVQALVSSGAKIHPELAFILRKHFGINVNQRP